MESISNLSVPDPGLLPKVASYLLDSSNWNTVMDISIVAKDGLVFQWNSLLLASLSPFLSVLLLETEDPTVHLPDIDISTLEPLLSRLLVGKEMTDSSGLNREEKEILNMWQVNPFWSDDNESQLCFQSPPQDNYMALSPIKESNESDFDVDWTYDFNTDVNIEAKMPDNNFNVEYRNDQLEDTPLKRSTGGSNGRKMFCKLCSLSFADGPYSEYQTHISSHKNENGQFACRVVDCNRVFKSWCHLNDHAYSHGSLAKPHMCSHCSYSSTTRANVKKHEMAVHVDPERRDFSCDQCPKKFKTSSNLYEHLRVHNPAYRHVCELCNKEFKSLVGFQQHLRIHSGDLFSCGICGERFQSKHSVNRHEKDIHGVFNMSEGVKIYKCPNRSCSAEFSGEEEYRLHVKTAHQEKSSVLICYQCKKICTNKMALKMHMKKQHFVSKDKTRRNRKKSLLLKQEPEVNPTLVVDKQVIQGVVGGDKCDCCDKKWRRQYQLLSHLGVMRLGGRFCLLTNCPLKEKEFSSLESLELHLQTHTGEVSFSCSHCSQNFISGGARDRHEASHQGDPDNPLVCRYCGANYPSQLVINMHEKYCTSKGQILSVTSENESLKAAMSDSNIPDPSKEQSKDVTNQKFANDDRLNCDICTLKFPSSDDFNKHKDMFHSKDIVKCSFCDKAVAKSTLSKHIKQLHFEKQTVKCSGCHKHFSGKQTLERHMISHHSKEVLLSSKSPVNVNSDGREQEEFIVLVNKISDAEDGRVNPDKRECENQGSSLYNIDNGMVDFDDQSMVLTLEKDDMIVYEMESQSYQNSVSVDNDK